VRHTAQSAIIANPAQFPLAANTPAERMVKSANIHKTNPNLDIGMVTFTSSCFIFSPVKFSLVGRNQFVAVEFPILPEFPPKHMYSVRACPMMPTAQGKGLIVWALLPKSSFAYVSGFNWASVTEGWKSPG